MSTIFSHALNQIKSTSETRSAPQGSKKKLTSTSYEENKDPGSILNRIQLNKKTGNSVKSITIRKNSDDYAKRFEIESIQKKVIKKEPIPVKKVTKKADIEGAWKHDLYDGPTIANPTNMYCTVFVRNLPETVSSQQLRETLQDDEFVIGVRVDNGTAEINFSKRDAAQKAADELNGKVLRGKKIKAAVMGEINTSSKPKQSNRYEEAKEDNNYGERSSMKTTKMHADEESDHKPSILNRIKKNH